MAKAFPTGLGRPGRDAEFAGFVDALVFEIATSDTGSLDAPPELTDFVARRRNGVTAITALGLTIVERVLRLGVLAIDWTRFEDLDTQRRRRWITEWESSRFGVVRQYVRFYRSLVLLWIFEERYADRLEDHR